MELVMLLALAGLLLSTPAAGQKLGPQRCNQLSGLGRGYCRRFISSGDSYTKFQAASDWARFATDSYLCAGITPLCLGDDIRRPQAFNTTCRVPLDETPCGDDPENAPGYCRDGVCVDYSGNPMPTRDDLERVQIDRARTLFAMKYQQIKYQQQGPDPPPAAPPPPGQKPNWGPEIFVNITIDQDSLGRLIPPSFIGISREYTNESVYWDRNLPAWGAILDVLGPSPIIRLGGASQEALTAPPTPEYMRSLVALHCALGVRYIIGLPLFQNSPALALTIKQAYDKAFANFPRAILSYELGNEPNYWPSGSAGAFIWGTGPTQCVKVNYPDPPPFVPNGAGPMVPPGTVGAAGQYFLYTPYQKTYQPFYADQVCYTPRTLDFYPGFARYATYFGTAANTISGCNGPQTPEQALWSRPYWGPTARPQNVVSGPGWGTLRLGGNNLTQLIALSKGCFWNEATLHYYTPVANRNATIEAMFSQLSIDQAMADLKGLLDATQNDTRIRISESNSIAGGGRSGVSNVFAAALWTAEIAFEFAMAGASGINFHWGNAGLFSAPGAEPAYIGVTNRFFDNDPNRPYPVVRAPWYGYVLFSRATGNNGPAVAVKHTKEQSRSPFSFDCINAVQLYSFLLPGTSEISLAAINKYTNVTCKIQLSLNGRHPDATLTRLLPGKEGLSSIRNITWGGATYENSTTGRLRGDAHSELVKAEFVDPDVGDWNTTYTFKVPPASAALLLVPTLDGGTQPSGPAEPTPEEKEQQDFEAAQRARSGLIIPALPSVYGPLATQYRSIFGNNAEAERLGRGQFALQPDGSYRPVNTPVPSGPVKQGYPPDGGAGIKQANAACPGIQRIAENEKNGLLLKSMFSDRRRRRRLLAAKAEAEKAAAAAKQQHGRQRA